MLVARNDDDDDNGSICSCFICCCRFIFFCCCCYCYFYFILICDWFLRLFWCILTCGCFCCWCVVCAYFVIITIIDYIIHCLIPDIGMMVRVFANGPGDLGSLPGRVIPKTLKMVLDVSLLNTQHYKVGIKGKV